MTEDLGDGLARIAASIGREAAGKRELRTMLSGLQADIAPRAHGSIMGSVPFGDSMLLASPGIATIPASTIGDDILPYHGNLNWCHDPVLSGLARAATLNDAGLANYWKGGWHLVSPTFTAPTIASYTTRGSAANPFNSYAVELGGDTIAGAGTSTYKLQAYSAVTAFDYGRAGYLLFAFKVTRKPGATWPANITSAKLRAYLIDSAGPTTYSGEWYDLAVAQAAGTEKDIHLVYVAVPVSDYTKTWKYGVEYQVVTTGASTAPKFFLGDPQGHWWINTQVLPYSPPLGAFIAEGVYAYGDGTMGALVSVIGTYEKIELQDSGKVYFDSAPVGFGGTLQPFSLRRSANLDGLTLSDESLSAHAYLTILGGATGAKNAGVLFGDTTPTIDARIYRSGVKYIKVDDGAGGNVTFDVIGTLYNNGAPVGGGGPATQVDRASGANGDYLAKIKLTADTTYRLFTGFGVSSAIPTISFGPGGTSAMDVSIYRNGTKTLWIDDAAGGAMRLSLIGDLVFYGTGGNNARLTRIAAGTLRLDTDGVASLAELQILGAAAQRATINARLSGDTNERVGLWGDGTLTGITLGPGNAVGDIRWRRSGAKTLTFDDGGGGSITANVVGTLQQGGSGVIIAGDYTAKGVILAGTGVGTKGAVTVGADGTFLMADSAAAAGVSWSALAQVSRASGAAGDYVARIKLTADTQYRLVAELRTTTSEPQLLFGPGGVTAPDLRVARSTTKTLTIDDGAGGSATVNVVGTLQQGGTGVMTSPFTTNGDIVYYNGTVPARLGGAAGFLKSTGASAPAWSAIAESDVTNLVTDLAAKMTNPMTTSQDLIVGGVSGAPGRLGKGTADQVLQMDGTGTNVGWRTFTSGAASQVDRASGAAGDYLARIKLTADTQYRLNIGLDGSSNPTILLGPGSTTAPDMRLYRSAAKTFLFDDNASGAVTVTFASTSTVNFGGAGLLDLNNAKLRIPVAAGITLTTTEGYVGYDSTVDDVLVYDSQRQRVVNSVGWTPTAYPFGFVPTATLGTGVSLAANGGSIAIPVLVPSHMLLSSVTVWNTDTTTARTWGWDLYRQYLNNGNAAENTLTRVAASNANETFTPAAASARNIVPASAPVYLAPGVYWLVIQNRHATSTFGVGSATIGTIGTTVKTAQTKTTTNPNGATLDFVAATWTKVSNTCGAVLHGRVFGQTSGF
jgi:hypothetical protein